MKAKYVTPTLTQVELGVQDVVTASVGEEVVGAFTYEWFFE